jgi:hypothetical protein
MDGGLSMNACVRWLMFGALSSTFIAERAFGAGVAAADSSSSTLENLLLGANATLVVAGIIGMFRLAMVVRETLVELRHLRENHDKLEVRVDKVDEKVEKVEKNGRDGRAELWNHFRQWMGHTPVHGVPKVDK